MRADWNAFPRCAFIGRDAKMSQNNTKVTTNRVFMIEGTDYYMPIAVNDKSLAEEQPDSRPE